LQGEVNDLKTREQELSKIKSQAKIAKQKAEIAKLRAEKALLKSNMEVQDKESKSKGIVSMGEKQSPLSKPAEKLNALANALSKGEDEEEDDEDHDQAGSGHRLAKILKLLEKEIVARTEPEEEEPKEAPKDGMEELKEFFSGEEGLKRSDSFIKFAKLLTEGDS